MAASCERCVLPCCMLDHALACLQLGSSSRGCLCMQFKLNTDESPSIATEYGIRSIPTVIIYKGGQRVDAVIGAVPKQTLMKAIDKYID